MLGSCWTDDAILDSHAANTQNQRRKPDGPSGEDGCMEVLSLISTTAKLLLASHGEMALVAAAHT